jgi:Tol biopolymer transport system component
MRPCRRSVAATCVAVASTLLASRLAAQTPTAPPLERVAFTTTEGTWVSLDVTRDGRALVFELLGDIYRVPVDGGQAAALITGRAFQSQPRLSPDGAQLLFISDETGSDNVWIASADGSNARAVTRLPRVGMLSPAWATDGRSVVVTVTDPHGTRTAELWRYDVASGQGTRLVPNGNGPAQPLVSAPAPGPYGAWPTPMARACCSPRSRRARTAAATAPRARSCVSP